MQFNLQQMQQQQAESSNGGGSEQVSISSDESRLLLAFRKIMKKEVEVMVIHTVKQVIVPIVEDLVRKVVKEEIQSAHEKILTGNRNGGGDITMSGRNLRLKFLDKISSTVLTGKDIKGEGGNEVKIALVDEKTGDVIHDEPEASAVVEILVLEAGDNGCKRSLEEFNNRIIRDNAKKKPHFTKSQYVHFKEGVGVLRDIKLAQDSSWTKNCQCRLGARIVGDFGGIKVKEALTNSFMVKDGRGSLYDKHYPPYPTDELWRLENIGKDGAPCKRLNDENIKTVQHFLSLLTTDPERLKKIAMVRGKLWEATVNHAQTCVIDGTPSSESRMGVVFDVVGGTKEIIRDSQFVNNLSEAEKVCQHKLLLSAIENRKDMTSSDDEASLLCQFPCPSTTKNDSNLGIGPSRADLAISANTVVHDSEEAGRYVPSAGDIVTDLGFRSSSDMLPPYDEFCDISSFLETFGDNEGFISLISPKGNNSAETFMAEIPSGQKRGASCTVWPWVWAVVWVLRARKKFTCQGDIHVSKKQKTC